ncbi:MAG: AbrB/MazE/SpoVT family DNA-binding domain-containing protein [Verrucomicrobiota bacterium]
MTTVSSQKGQVVLPADIREQLNLQPGDDFEVFVDGEDTIHLKRISKRPNEGLVDLLLSAPGELEIPARSRDLPEAPAFD